MTSSPFDFITRWRPAEPEAFRRFFAELSELIAEAVDRERRRLATDVEVYFRLRDEMLAELEQAEGRKTHGH